MGPAEGSLPSFLKSSCRDRDLTPRQEASFHIHNPQAQRAFNWGAKVSSKPLEPQRWTRPSIVSLQDASVQLIAGGPGHTQQNMKYLDSHYGKLGMISLNQSRWRIGYRLSKEEMGHRLGLFPLRAYIEKQRLQFIGVCLPMSRSCFWRMLTIGKAPLEWEHSWRCMGICWLTKKHWKEQWQKQHNISPLMSL